MGALVALAWTGVASDASARAHGRPTAMARIKKVLARTDVEREEAHPVRAVEPRLLAWIRARAPKGVTLSFHEGEVELRYETKEGDTVPALAKALLPLSEIYLASDFTEALLKANPALRAGIKSGMTLAIPSPVKQAYAEGPEGRLGWPKDGDLRGVYVRGMTAGGHSYEKLLDHLVDHGMNAIVLDTKDTDGLLTYPSEVAAAVETGATAHAPIADLSRTIRFAHQRGIRVAMRVSCFHDEWMQHHKAQEMSVRGKWGGIYPLGWLDPSSEAAHRYLIDLAKEAMDAGADEVELDYVRYPVIGIKNADFKLDKIGKTKPEVIRDFVREMHAVTKARGVPLSLDVFGVVADGKRVDIDMLGQDVAMLGAECEALSPMLYPSHYASGYLGFEIPGTHPELVGVGTKGTVAQLRGESDAPPSTHVRPWVQAVSYESPDYGPQYLAQELKSAEANGATGWLMWNPSQDYSTAWAAVPRKPAARLEVASSTSDRPAR
ncbi:MAG TPA: putative glycoside hydrolase [Polyangiaceae bacterium]